MEGLFIKLLLFVLFPIVSILYTIYRKKRNQKEYNSFNEHVEELKDETGSIREVINSLQSFCVRLSTNANSLNDIKVKNMGVIDGIEIQHMEKIDENKYLIIAVKTTIDNSMISNITANGSKELFQFRYLFDFNFEEKCVKVFSDYFSDLRSRNLMKSTAISIFNNLFEYSSPTQTVNK